MFDLESAMASLSSVEETPPPEGWPSGAPARDFLRSPAAVRVGHLAAREGLFCFHFEHRFALDLPDAWIEPGQESAAEPPRWAFGRLPERKYQSFRHDLMIASFHPGHRGKWTTHELCHALVGFAWRPDASPFFHATAARLAELLPVVLYYFLDEVGLSRCDLHAGGGPLYREYCAACEAVAGIRVLDEADRSALHEAARFLDRELAAVAKSRRLGVPVAHRYGSLDLCSDGLAYARGHQRRLGSEAMERLAPFLNAAQGAWRDLQTLEARVEEVFHALALGAPLSSLGGSREVWAAQDLAFRLLTVWEQTDGEAAKGIEGLLDQLGRGEPVQEGWKALCADFVLPTEDQLFAVGYDSGIHLGQMHEGLKSIVPLSLELASDAGVDVVRDFARSDPSVRVGIGDRFVAWAAMHHPSLSELAAFEVALQSVTPDPLAALGPGEGLVLCTGARVIHGSVHLADLAAGVDSGSVTGVLEHGRIEHSFTGTPTAWVIGRGLDGEVILVQLEPEDASGLVEGRGDRAILEELCELGVARATRW